MTLQIESTMDAGLLARLNEAIQKHHVRLYPATFKTPARQEVEAFVAERLKDPAWRALIANVDGEAAGYALFYLRNYAENPFRRAYTGVHVDQVSVEPRFKRQGVGQALMAAVEAFAREQGASQLELTVWDRNEEARVFYRGLGFGTTIHFQVKSL